MVLCFLPLLKVHMPNFFWWLISVLYFVELHWIVSVCWAFVFTLESKYRPLLIECHLSLLVHSNPCVSQLNDLNFLSLQPSTTNNIDPAVLASLPPSMQLDLLVQVENLWSVNLFCVTCFLLACLPSTIIINFFPPNFDRWEKEWWLKIGRSTRKLRRYDDTT